MEPVSDESGAPPSSGQRTAVEHAFAPLGTDAAGAQADVAVPGWLANSPAWARVGLLAVAHFPIFWLAYGLAFALRFDFSLPPRMAELFWISLPWVAVCKLLIFYLAGHYHGWWRHVTFADLISLLKAAGLSLLVLAALDHFALPLQIPRSVLVLDCLFTILLLGALRASWRLVRTSWWPMRRREQRDAILVGAGHASGILAHQIQSHPQSQYRIKGFVDPDPASRGMRLGGIPVLGSTDDIQRIAVACRASVVLVISGTLAGHHLRLLMQACDSAGLALKIIPPIEDLFEGNRELPVRNVEITDILRREPVQLSEEAIAGLIEGRTVMVTGAGGSIGSEICRQLLRFHPQRLVLVGKGEHSIFSIDQELRRSPAEVVLHPVIGDVTDGRRMRQIMEEHRPQVVFHAAAHKHVPLMESNVGEAIKNNLFGTKCIADLSDEYAVQAFVLISTDKAVNPTSVMGVTKQIAERYIHTLSQESSTRFIVVRFGNVLGSSGSVVPIFLDQIRRGGPITVTDPRMTRYFMTIPEASQLVLQAAAMGKGGEIFVLEMGDPVKVTDLARDLVRLAGLPEGAIDIVYTGLRPGEKLYEELYFDEEATIPTTHPKLRAAYHRPYSLGEVRESIDLLRQSIHEPSESLRRVLRNLVPEYLVAQTEGPLVAAAPAFEGVPSQKG